MQTPNARINLGQCACIVAGVTFAVSCSERGGCVRGEAQACACSDGRSGAQECDDSGESFGPCLCSGSESDAGADGPDLSNQCPEPDAIPVDTGCAKIDFLFVVDNSQSMDAYQEALIASFPGFISEIRGQLEARNYHIMVVDSDPSSYPYNLSACEFSCRSGDPPPEVCDGYVCSSFLDNNACDIALGGGVVFPRNGRASNRACGFEEGRRYLTDEDGDLVDAFSCAARTGVMGWGEEQPMEALLTAISPQMTGSGGCNEGFLRDDAVLVVVILSDANPWEGSMEEVLGDPARWKERLLARKCDREDAVVVLGLLGDRDVEDNVCVSGTDEFGNRIGDNADSPRKREFVLSFGEQGILGSICESDYTTFFSEAVNLIDTTCDEFSVF